MPAPPPRPWPQAGPRGELIVNGPHFTTDQVASLAWVTGPLLHGEVVVASDEGSGVWLITFIPEGDVQRLALGACALPQEIRDNSQIDVQWRDRHEQGAILAEPPQVKVDAP